MSAQKLGAVGLVLLGMWWVLAGIEHLATSLLHYQGASPSAGYQWFLIGFMALPIMIGACLLWRAPSLARRFLPVDEIRHGPGMAELMPAAIAALALFLIVARLQYVLRIVLPFLWAEEDQLAGTRIPWVELATTGVAALAFWYSHQIARLWKWSGQDATRT